MHSLPAGKHFTSRGKYSAGTCLEVCPDGAGFLSRAPQAPRGMCVWGRSNPHTGGGGSEPRNGQGPGKSSALWTVKKPDAKPKLLDNPRFLFKNNHKNAPFSKFVDILSQNIQKCAMCLKVRGKGNSLHSPALCTRRKIFRILYNVLPTSMGGIPDTPPTTLTPGREGGVVGTPPPGGRTNLNAKGLPIHHCLGVLSLGPGVFRVKRNLEWMLGNATHSNECGAK